MEIKQKEKDLELEKSRHSMAHILAKVIVGLYPKAKLTIGPAIEDGFYYDIDLDHSISNSEYDAIEKKMKEILNKGENFERKVVSKEEALKLFAGNEYKTEIINDLPEGEEVSLYYTGEDFYDLCRGPHVESAKQLQNMGYKIHSVNGEEAKKIKCFKEFTAIVLRLRKSWQIISQKSKMQENATIINWVVSLSCLRLSII